MILHPHLLEEDEEVAGDIRTAREVAKMGSSISDMIQLTWDSPSNNINGKMAMLNTEVWVEGNKVLYEHFRKPMANDLLMMEISAMPAKIKRATLAQKVVTIRTPDSGETSAQTFLGTSPSSTSTTSVKG